MVGVFSDDTLRMSFHNGQSNISSVVYSMFVQVMPDWLCNKVNRKTLDAHIGKFFDHSAEASGVSMSLKAKD